MRRVKRAARGNARKSDLNADFIKYTQFKAEVDETLYKTKQDYEDSLVNQIQTGPKRFNNYARCFIRSSSTIYGSFGA